MKKLRTKRNAYKHTMTHAPILLLMLSLLLMLLVPVLMIGLRGPIPLNSFAVELGK